jgi:hypothetical protein
MEVVGGTGVLKIMDDGCHQGGKYLQVCQPVLTVKTYTYIHPRHNNMYKPTHM